MNNKMLVVLGILLVGIMGSVSAVSSTTWVNFTVGTGSCDFDGQISDLEVESRSEDNIVWVWENSEDERFSHNLVFLDGVLVGTGDFERFEASGLAADTCYEISVISVGTDGKRGMAVVDVACTLESGNGFSGQVGNLEVESRDEDKIVWVWENSENSDFSHNLVYLNGVLVGNGTFERFEASGLDEDTCYEISVISVGKDGEKGAAVRDVACTLKADDGEKRKSSGKKTGMRDDVIPNFFVEGDEVLSGNVVIALGSSPEESGEWDILPLIWAVLILFIILLLIFLLVVLARG